MVTVGINKSYQHITFEIDRISETPWYFSTIYTSPDPSKCTNLWQQLKEFAHTHNKPWLIGGDFNDISMESIELEFSRPSHTWAPGCSDNALKSARLDRVLCNSECSTRYSNAAVKHLPVSIRSLSSIDLSEWICPH
ncbi:Succinyl-diaminopimelate desuccinylase [Bienertia sinuspersici]